jgi:hypothetical protein
LTRSKALAVRLSLVSNQVLGGLVTRRNPRYKPVIPITVIGPKSQETSLILVDSGSDEIVFPIDLAIRLGIDLTLASKGSSVGVGTGQPVALLFAPVILLLDDNVETCRWRAAVGFTQAPLRFPLFGIAGGLEHFRTTLDVVDREIILTAKLSVPTTMDLVP